MTIPKAIKATMLMNNWLYIEFDNGEKRYLPSYFIQDYQNSWDIHKKLGAKRLAVLANPTITWIGAKIEIDADGNLIVNGNERYTSEEIWKHGKINYI